MKFYEKMGGTSMRRDHFYKFFRWVFFGKFIVTLDIYPGEVKLGLMMSGSLWNKTLLRLT